MFHVKLVMDGIQREVDQSLKLFKAQVLYKAFA